jgi:hypothetical protein
MDLERAGSRVPVDAAVLELLLQPAIRGWDLGANRRAEQAGCPSELGVLVADGCHLGLFLAARARCPVGLFGPQRLAPAPVAAGAGGRAPT